MKITETQLRLLIRKKLLSEKRIDYSKKGEAGFSSSGTSNLDSLLKRVGGNVKWGEGSGAEARKAAWIYLEPFIPATASLTSAFRSQEDQDRIIKNFAEADKEEYFKWADNNNKDRKSLDAMHEFVTKVKEKEVARKTGRGHGGKNGTGAIDVSGADLDQIWAAVEKANSTIPELVKFAGLNQGKGSSSIIERKQNAVHIHFDLHDIKLPFDKSTWLAKTKDQQSNS